MVANRLKFALIILDGFGIREEKEGRDYKVSLKKGMFQTIKRYLDTNLQYVFLGRNFSRYTLFIKRLER